MRRALHMMAGQGRGSRMLALAGRRLIHGISPAVAAVAPSALHALLEADEAAIPAAAIFAPVPYVTAATKMASKNNDCFMADLLAWLALVY